MLKMIIEFLEWIAGLLFYTEDQNQFEYENNGQFEYQNKGQRQFYQEDDFISANFTESFVRKDILSEIVKLKPTGLSQVLQSRRKEIRPHVAGSNRSESSHISQNQSKEVSVSSSKSSEDVPTMSWKQFREYNRQVDKFFT